MIVRFMGNKDGHTVVLSKYGTDVYVFQAYYSVCAVHMAIHEIFSSELNNRLKQGECVSANEFGNVADDIPYKSYTYPSEQYTRFVYAIHEESDNKTLTSKLV